MEAVSTSETSVSFYGTTRRSIPEESHVYTRRRENLKSQHPEYLFRSLGEEEDPGSSVCTVARLRVANGVRFPAAARGFF
jgi:hypothetical protein